MKKIIIAVYAVVCLLTIAGCSDGMVKVPADANDYAGQNYQTVIADLQKAGFTNIAEDVIADLTSSGSLNDGTVELVSIGNSTDFSAKDKFEPSTDVIVTYHIIPKFNPPISSDDIQTIFYGEIAELFNDVGFTIISADEVYDIDPDENSADFINEVIINDISSFSVTDDIPFDANIKIVGHYPYSKHTVKINIDFISNWIFDKYGVDVLFNGVKYKSLGHGEDAEFEARLKDDKYTLTFESSSTKGVKGETTLDVDCNVDASYTIYCHSDYIKVEKNYVDYKRELAEGEVKTLSTNSSFIGDNYKEAISTFEEWGFTNIKAVPVYDIYFGITSEESVASVFIGGEKNFKYGDIFRKDAEVVINYHMDYTKDPARNTGDSNPDENNGQTSSTTQTSAKPTYDIDENLLLVRCEKDDEYTTMYNIVFADTDSSGNILNYYSFDSYKSIINPRTMGKEFHAIGDLPSWFKVGNYVHVKANFSSGGLSTSKCSVTEPTEENGESANTNEGGIDMPVMKGTSVDEVREEAAKYGVSHIGATEDYGHGTTRLSLDDNKNRVTLSIIYSNDSKEILTGRIVPFKNMSIQEQRDFITAMSKVLCPKDDVAEVSKWVSSNLGDRTQTTISDVIYELSIGSVDNIVYFAGEINWENWDASF